MTLTVCSHCGTMLQLPDNYLGQRAKCTHCNKVFDAQPLKKNLSASLPQMPPGTAVRSLTCTQCGTVLQVPDNHQGKRIKCVSCNTILDVPSASKNNVTSRQPSLSRETIPTVVARRSGPAPQGSRRMHLGWVVAAVAALMVPILTASSVTAWRLTSAWRSGGAGSSKAVYAGIEIGSNGPRYCVVEFLPESNGGDNFRVVAHEATTARVTSKMESTGTFNPDELGKTMSAVQSFYERLVKEHQVPPERIVIVSSDTLFGPIVKRPDIDEHEKDRQITRCRESLSAAVKKATGQTMEFVSLRKFAEHELRAVVRKSDLTNAVFLDIGGGSTRGAYCDAANLIQAAEGPGIQSFIGRVKDGLLDDGNFAERAEAMSEQHLREPFRTALAKDPEFTARPKIYLAGGIAWVMANCQHPADTEDYVHLSAADINQFTANVRKQPELLTTIRPDANLAAERQEWLKGEYARMRNAFKTPERLVAGAEILQALSTELKFSGRDIWFYRHSDFAWVASYIEQTRRPRK